MSNKSGFTLIEITIAIAVLVIGLVSILALFPFAMYSNKVASDSSTASLIAQQQMDLIRTASNAYPSGLYPAGNTPPGNLTEYPGFTWVAIVLDTTLLKSVNFRIYWIDPKGDIEDAAKKKYMFADFNTYIAK